MTPRRSTPPATRPAPRSLSVGELVRQADVTARMLMVDLDGRAAPAMVRTWPEVVEAAAALWRGLPREYPAIDNRERFAVDQLEALSRGLHLSMISQHSYPAAAGDSRLREIVGMYERAAELIDRFRDEVDPVTSAHGRADLSATRISVVHTLWVASHGVASTVQAHQDVVGDLWRGPYRDVQLANGPELITRLRAFEQIAGTFVHKSQGRYVAATVGAAADAPPGVERLDAALQAWDIHRREVLTAGGEGPAAADALLAARVPGVVATATAVLSYAILATEGFGQVDRDAVAKRLVAMQRSWSDLATRWAELALVRRTTTPSLQAAAVEVHAAVRQVMGDGASWASPPVLAARVDLSAAAAPLQRSLAAGVETGYALRDIAETSAILQAPAKVMNIRSASDARLLNEGAAWIAPSGDPSRPVALTPVARAGLSDACDGAALAAGRAAGAVTDLQPARSGAALLADRLARAQRMDVMAKAALYRTSPSTAAARGLSHTPPDIKETIAPG